MRKLKRLIKIILVFLVLVIVIFLIKEKNTIIKNDIKFFVVKSGSMYPKLEVGDLIIVQKKNNYITGDIITYKENGNYITHRIVGLKNDKYVTKGDSNNTEDLELVEHKEIIGKVIKNYKNYNEKKKKIVIIFIFLILIYLSFEIRKIFSNKRIFEKIKKNKKILNINNTKKVNKNKTKKILFIILFFIINLSIFVMGCINKSFGKYYSKVSGMCVAEIEKPIIEISDTEPEIVNYLFEENDIFIKNYKINEQTNEIEINKMKVLCKVKVRKYIQGIEINDDIFMNIKLNNELLDVHEKNFEFIIGNEEMENYNIKFTVMNTQIINELKIFAEITFEQIS